jgi:hypothetical protein
MYNILSIGKGHRVCDALFVKFNLGQRLALSYYMSSFQVSFVKSSPFSLIDFG